MIPLNPDIMFTEARYRQEHLRAIAHQEPLFGRLRARWSRRRRPEPTTLPVEVRPVPPVVPATPEAAPAVEVHIPAQRLPGQVGSPAASAPDAVPTADVEPVRRPTPH